jgi:hypothetical protein
MYWTEAGTANKIQRANLDGTGVEDLVTGLGGPQGIALALETYAFTYQGRLIEANTAADGLYDLQFELYAGPADGSQQGGTIYINELDVIDGYFTVELSFDARVFNGEALWLEIGVRPGDSNDVYTILSPRQEITPAPYAICAKTTPDVHSLDAADGSPTDALYVDDSGKVGIGTTCPQGYGGQANSLDVVGGILSRYGIAVIRDDDWSGFNWTGDNGVNDWGLGVYGDSTKMHIMHDNNERFTITSDGNVGIGTTSPSEKLEVKGGAMKATDGLIIETRTSDPANPVTGQIWLRPYIP